MLLLIDNYDSFVYNLGRYFTCLGQDVHIVRNDQAEPGLVKSLSPDFLVFSPGPKKPIDAGYSIELIQQFHQRIPILGVCLGHQSIAQAFGGEIVHADKPVHGRASVITRYQGPLFSNLSGPLEVGRYHALQVSTPQLPRELEIHAATNDGTIMAIGHRDFPVFGTQFHPESILTPCGMKILENFLRVGCGETGRA